MANSRTRNREFKECFFLEPDSPELDFHRVFEIALRKANSATDNRDTCAFVANLLIMVNPGFKDVLTNRLTELGIRVSHTVKLPSQAEEYLIDYPVYGNFTFNEIYVITGCTILLLFKYVSPANYVNFMTKRMKAMCSYTGSDEMPVPYSYTKAESIRLMLGASMPVKAAVIRFLISNFDTNFRLSVYLCGFLAWSEMYAYKTMHDTLILNASPILEDRRVRHEGDNLNDTHKAVTESDYPQFFRFLGGNIARAKLEKSRFRILFAVAKNLTIYRQNYPNFVTSCDLSEQENQLVRELIEIHNREMSRPGRVTPYSEKLESFYADLRYAYGSYE